MNPSFPEKTALNALGFNSEVEADVLARISERLAHDCGNLLARILAVGEEFQFHLEDGTPFPEGPQLMRQNVLRTKELMQKIVELPRKSAPSSFHDLNVLVAEAAELVRKFLPRGVRLETRTESESLPVFADAVAFRWMFIELAWMAATTCSPTGKLSFVTSRQAGSLGAGFCLLLEVAAPVQPLARTFGTAPNHIDPFVERCGAVFSVENGTAYRIWLPEAEMT